MDFIDVVRLFGIISTSLVLLFVFTITSGTKCFSPFQLLITYSLLTYTILVEIFDLTIMRS